MDGSEQATPDVPMPYILYVEDDDHIFRLVHLTLGREGFRVVQAEDAARGIQMAREEKPDLILMDVWLPGEIDGFDATELIKSDPDLQDIPVVVLTAQHAGGVQNRAAAVRCDAFLSKPISMQKLSICITGLLNRRDGHNDGQE